MRRKTMKGLLNQLLHETRVESGWSQKEVADRIGATTNTVSRWELGVAFPGPYFRTKLCTLFGKSAEELGFAPQEVPSTRSRRMEMDRPVEAGLWGIPYQRNPFFTGREDLLHSLHERLSREHTIALTQSWAISGLGGIGKTQIALEYAYQYRQEYRAVFWASAASRETLHAGLVNIADLLQLPEKAERDQNKIIKAVKKWLATHQGWLLILDNADEVTVVQDMAFSDYSGHLLLTTRAQALGSVAQRIEVETLGMVEATLSQRALVIREGVYGHQHLKTIETCECLQAVLAVLEEAKDATP